MTFKIADLDKAAEIYDTCKKVHAQELVLFRMIYKEKGVKSITVESAYGNVVLRPQSYMPDAVHEVLDLLRVTMDKDMTKLFKQLQDLGIDTDDITREREASLLEITTSKPPVKKA